MCYILSAVLFTVRLEVGYGYFRLLIGQRNGVVQLIIQYTYCAVIKLYTLVRQPSGFLYLIVISGQSRKRRKGYGTVYSRHTLPCCQLVMWKIYYIRIQFFCFFAHAL